MRRVFCLTKIANFGLLNAGLFFELITTTSPPSLGASDEWVMEVLVATFWKTGGSSPDFFFSFGKEEKQAILYIRNIEMVGCLDIIPEIFSAEIIASKNISQIKRDKNLISFIPNLKKGNGSVIILLSSLSCKENLEADKTFHSSEIQKTMKVYLAEENIFDFSSSEVKNVISGIAKRLSSERKNVPYWQALSALDFAHWNIKYSRVPRETIEQLEKKIKTLPNDSVFSLLRNSFTWNELPLMHKQLGKLAENIVVPKYADTAFEKARYMLNEFDQKCPILFERWNNDERLVSASKTIRDGTGKCDCIVHVFVALCRSMGIPAMKVDGYIHPQGWHAWALVYLHPYGWVDVDPTNSFCFGKFNHDTHLYHFIHDRFMGNINFLTRKEPITEKSLRACKYFYEHSLEHPSKEKLLEILER